MKLHKGMIAKVRGSRSERSIAFFDAVMAVAITILVLELPVTESSDFNWAAVQDLFEPMTAYLISFMTLGEIWLFHNRIYSLPYFEDHCSEKMTLFLCVLMGLFPKATELIATYSDEFWAVILYLLIVIGLIALLALSIRLSLKYVSRDFFAGTAIKPERLRVIPVDFTEVVSHMQDQPSIQQAMSRLGKSLKLELYSVIAMTVSALGAAILFLVWTPGAYLCMVLNIVLEAIFHAKINDDDLEEVLENADYIAQSINREYEHRQAEKAAKKKSNK